MHHREHEDDEQGRKRPRRRDRGGAGRQRQAHRVGRGPVPDSLGKLVPGLAFGTGTHATTALCLGRLARIPLAGARVLDVGCGSGILAIAAGRLGAGVVAVDHDPQARRATLANARYNGVDVDIGSALDAADDQFDVVLANLVAETIRDLAADLIRRLAPGGELLLFGHTTGPSGVGIGRVRRLPAVSIRAARPARGMGDAAWVAMSESERVLISECPGCHTRFQVTDEQLGVARGRVRCGACLTVFDGRRAAATGSTPAEHDPIDVLLATSVPRPDAESADVPTAKAGAAPSPTSTDGIEPPSVEAAKVRDIPPVVFAVAIAAALALLAAGILVLQYDVHSQRPEMREMYQALGFEPPRYKALDAIRVVDPSVDERLGSPHDLVVRLELANTAPLSQRFPPMAVRFHDAGGSVLAERRIEPAEYLPSPAHTRRMLPNRNFPVSLRLDDPGAEATSYSISLL